LNLNIYKSKHVVSGVFPSSYTRPKYVGSLNKSTSEYFMFTYTSDVAPMKEASPLKAILEAPLPSLLSAVPNFAKYLLHKGSLKFNRAQIPKVSKTYKNVILEKLIF
jgi:hypothetical protein